MSFIINPDDKFYPDHNSHIWTYCTFLGKFTDEQGRNHDLGVFFDETGIYDATTHSDAPEDYSSGEISQYIKSFYQHKSILTWKQEIFRRLDILNIKY